MRVRDVGDLVARCQRLRRDLGRPLGPWSRTRILTALDQALTGHGWPPELAAAAALLAVAADRHTASPYRLSAPGSWWDTSARSAAPEMSATEQAQLDLLERQLAELPDGGIGAQRAARQQLRVTVEHLDRLTLMRHAVSLVPK